MAVRLTCIDNASGHDGLRWRMGDNENEISILLGETPPGDGEMIVANPIEPNACFSVCAFVNNDESERQSICATTSSNEFAGVEVGDEAGGGIYAGVLEINGSDYHIIFALQSGQIDPPDDTRVRTSTDSFIGAREQFDGLANTLAMQEQGITEWPAAAHCLSYVHDGHADWYLPARREVELALPLRNHPEFTASSLWSSTEGAPNITTHWRARLDTNSMATGTKDFDGFSVRPIRRVPV